MATTPPIGALATAETTLSAIDSPPPSLRALGHSCQIMKNSSDSNRYIADAQTTAPTQNFPPLNRLTVLVFPNPRVAPHETRAAGVSDRIPTFPECISSNTQPSNPVVTNVATAMTESDTVSRWVRPFTETSLRSSRRNDRVAPPRNPGNSGHRRRKSCTSPCCITNLKPHTIRSKYRLRDDDRTGRY